MVYREFLMVDCNTLEILEQHNNKKRQKEFEKTWRIVETWQSQNHVLESVNAQF